VSHDPHNPIWIWKDSHLKLWNPSYSIKSICSSKPIWIWKESLLKLWNPPTTLYPSIYLSIRSSKPIWIWKESSLKLWNPPPTLYPSMYLSVHPNPFEYEKNLCLNFGTHQPTLYPSIYLSVHPNKRALAPPPARPHPIKTGCGLNSPHKGGSNQQTNNSLWKVENLTRYGQKKRKEKKRKSIENENP